MQSKNNVKLTKLQRLVKWVYDTYPKTQVSNTELYIQFLECASIKRTGESIPESVKELMREFKPESITRARRSFAESTEGQRREEVEYIINYSK
jgi:hypothetical protein